MMHKKARKQFAEDKQTKDMAYWKHVLWSDETKINLFGSDGVKRVWRQPGEENKDKCLAYSQAWWWECHGLGLHECCRYWGATVHNLHLSVHPLPSETGLQGSIPTWWRPQTHLQDDHCLAKEAEGKGDGLAKYVPRPKPY